jgi:pyridinium-3,5-bisthiocarboxylic acid mononucleotide nickel chelatase
MKASSKQNRNFKTMTNILYCDCFSGISGDMFLGALLDAGLPIEVLSEQLKMLKLHEFQGVSAEKVHKGALAATLLNLDIHEHHEHPAEDENAEHEHAGHSHHDEEHAHHHHDEDHPHQDEHAHAHQHETRHLSDITALIQNSGLPDAVQHTSLGIFQKLAEAEAKVHGSTLEEVHFHEVGAVDSILDIVGAAIGLHYFEIHAVYASTLPLGSGRVKTQHGLLPLPAPATLELLRMAQAPVTASPATVELITPTGAAILASLASFKQPDMKLQRVGVGAGRRDLEWPNILRVFLGTQG